MTQESQQTLLGEVVAWDLGATEVSYQKVRDALDAAGLNPDAAAEMSPRSAFGRACKHLKDQRQIDKIEADGKTQVTKFQFTKRAFESGQLEFDLETFVYLNTDTGVITSDSPEMETKAQELFAYARQTRTNTDITRLVQGLFKANADLFPISPKGVAYFVPEVHRTFTMQVDVFLRNLGGKLCRFPVPIGTPEGNLSVKDAVQAGLSELLSELGQAVDGWDEGTRQSTMDRAVERWQAIQYKVEAYETYLGAEQERLKSGLATAKEHLAKRIQELRPSEEVTSPQAA